MWKRFKFFGQHIKSELRIYRMVIKDKRTSVVAKILLMAAVGYFLLPFDLIPDAIPVLGQLDDVIIVPVLVILALRIIPGEIIEFHRSNRS